MKTVMGEEASLLPRLLHRLPSDEEGTEPVTARGKGDTLARALWVTSQGEGKEGAAPQRALRGDKGQL